MRLFYCSQNIIQNEACVFQKLSTKETYYYSYVTILRVGLTGCCFDAIYSYKGRLHHYYLV